MLPGNQGVGSQLHGSGSKELDILYRISELVHSVHTSRERFLHTMEILDESFGERYGTLTLLNPSRKGFLLEVAFGDPSPHEGYPQGLNHVIVKEVLAHAQPMAFSRITQKPLSSPPRSIAEKNVTLLCTPIVNNMRAVGVMSTNPFYRDTLSFDRDIRLLQVIAWTAFQNAPLPGDDSLGSREPKGDPPLDKILERKLGLMIEKVDPRTESRCALLPDIVSLVEKIVIKWALKRHKNVQTGTALFLGINRNTLRKKMKDLNIHV